MPTQRKIFTVQNLAEKFKQAKALVLADYQGLSVTQINELRSEVKKVGGEFEVIKNTLLRLAAKENKHPVSEIQLKGPLAALWVYSDDPAPLKTIDSFIKKNERPKIKFGFWEDKLISIERIQELASLPDLNQLQAKLVATLQSPIFGLANALNWNIKKLLLTIKAAAKSGGQEGR
ncbi:MAG TPA: 50S ribosomal protein L10 [Nevskiaceae bacterium]|nr:50S ribosomal protein L10 [Nevskiaceae bacterium]